MRKSITFQKDVEDQLLAYRQSRRSETGKLMFRETAINELLRTALDQFTKERLTMPPDPKEWSQQRAPATDCAIEKLDLSFPSTEGWAERVWTSVFVAYAGQGFTAKAAALNADFAVKSFAEQNWCSSK